MRILWTAALAIVMTAVVSGIWAALLLTNLARSPGLPWSSIAMAAVLWMLWSFLSGAWGPVGTRGTRRAYLRAAPLPRRIYAWALIAGLLWVVFLAGFWIVLSQLVSLPGNKLPDFSTLPVLTVIATLIVASASGAISEEAGFRGYFQGSLERAGWQWSAVLCTALLMAPIHALTQGFVWPTLLFYLLVDAMLGTLAYLTKSILPGIVVHAVGLFVFLGLIWPADKNRIAFSQAGADFWFCLHLTQAVVFAALSLYALRRLARLVAEERALG